MREGVFDKNPNEKRALAQLQHNLDQEEDLEPDENLYETEENDFDPPNDPPRLEAVEEKDLNELSVDEIINRAEKLEDFDIFLDVGAPLAARGDHVTYSFRRAGKHVDTVEHPYSYEQLQKDYGGGSYVVMLRSQMFSKKKGGYLKSQSRTIENPRVTREKEAKESGSAAEMLALVQQMHDKTRDEQRFEMSRIREETRLREERLEREAKEREREAKEREQKRESDSANTLTLMMRMMQDSAQAAREAAQRQNEMLIAILTKAPTAPAPEKEDKRSEKMFDMLLNVLLDKKSKGESLDPIALHKLLSEAREEGYSRAQEIRELAREEAARMTARSGGGGDDEDEEKEEPKSTTKMLLETFAPIVAQLGTAMRAPQPGMMPMGVPGAPAMQRPMQRPVAPRQVGPNPNVPAKPRQLASPPAQAPQPGGEHFMKEANQPNPPQRTPQPPAQSAARGVLGQAKPQKVSMKPSKREIAAEVVINLIGADLSANIFAGKFDPEGTADKALLSLKDHEIDAKWLTENFTLADMKRVAKDKGIPDTVHPYLERFYARIETSGGVKEAPEAQSSAADH